MRNAKFYFKCPSYLTQLLTILMRSMQTIVKDQDEKMTFDINKHEFIPFAALTVSDQNFNELTNQDIDLVGYQTYNMAFSKICISQNKITMKIKLDPLFINDLEKSFPPEFGQLHFYNEIRLYENLNLTSKLVTALEKNFQGYQIEFPIFHEQVYLCFQGPYDLNENFRFVIYQNKVQLDEIEKIRKKDSALLTQRHTFTVPQSRKVIIPATNQTLNTDEIQLSRDREIESLKSQLADLQLNYQSIHDEFKTPKK